MPSAEDNAIMAAFARDYLELLDQRVAAIRFELQSGTDMDAHVALLSLESASGMVGAEELAKLTRLLRSAVERGQRSLIPALLRAVSEEAHRQGQRMRAQAHQSA